jgi:iron-sulfur cluster repair protein YtfE (RIC family)
MVFLREASSGSPAIGRVRREAMTSTAAVPGAVWAFAEHEHRELDRGLNHIHDIACEVQDWIAPELPTRLLGVLDWLDHVLEPHLNWEETWLYPQIDERTGTPWATRSSRFDHRQIRRMAGRVRDDEHRLHDDGAASAALPEVRCHLFGLEALLRSHIEREERFLIPIIAE